MEVLRRTHPLLSFSLRAALVLSLLACGLAAQEPAVEQQSEEDQWIEMRAQQGDSHASGMRPELGPVILGNPTQSVVVLRVGIMLSTINPTTGALTEFASSSHPAAEISNTAGDVHVIDEGSGKKIVTITPGMIVRVTHDAAGYNVSLDGAALGSFAGPIFFRPTDAANLFRVEHIRRSFITVRVPLYRGAIKITRGTATPAGRLAVVNVVELEDYVPGVVVNESLNSFHVEALKAQAIAARGYAVANIGRFASQGFDIVDSSSSQVYRGVISETTKAVQASLDTTGLVASYNGQIISALYSSSFGGHSENNEWIFNFPANQLPGSNATAYLRGIYDGEGTPPDFSSASGIAAFWANQQPSTFDHCTRVNNRFSRWRVGFTAAQLKTRLAANTSRYSVISGNTTGAVTNVEITQRMAASARAAVVRITFTTGSIEIRGWDNLRRILGAPPTTQAGAGCGTSSIAAGFVLNNPSTIDVAKNPDNTVNNITVRGGGWGHNVGLSQYGSNGRALAGQNFIRILKAYYTGVDIGSYPIDIGRDPGTGPPTLRQQFAAPNGIARLVIRADGLKGLRVHINDNDLSFTEEELAAGPVTANLTPYVTVGLNTIQYNPVGRHGSATVTVLVD